MAVLNSYRCAKCKKVKTAWSDDVPSCHRIRMAWLPMSFYTPEWGGPRDLLHLREQSFGSRSELKRYLKDEGLVQAESAEKVGGARNEEGLNLGKTYSYAGSPKG